MINVLRSIPKTFLPYIFFSLITSYNSQTILSSSLNKIKGKLNFSIDEIIKQKLLPLNIPIIQYLPIGHDYPNITIPIGSAFEFLSDDDLLIQKKIIFK